ncbi:MAG TPA: aldo/keto reductase [Tepidiformaceae bacterium]|nr:aldo/keto reductase [Tepidiformaceae bacterium]
MEFRNVGFSGLRVSVAGLGCNNFGMRLDQEKTQAVVDKAIDLGVTLFDTADVYGGGQSEVMLGKALGDRRQDVIVATKFGSPMGEGPYKAGGSRRYIMAACEASLKRLGTDYIDLYQIHRPDASTPLEETMRALEDLVRSGKVRYIGHSNFAGWQAAEAHAVAKYERIAPFISAQNEYSLLNRKIDGDLVPALQQYNVGLLPYFPLASGLLTGKYTQGQEPPAGTRLAAWGPRAGRMLSDRNFETIEKLTTFAQTRGHTILDLAMGWLASKSFVPSVIAGATSPEQIAQNVAALEWRLTPGEMAEVDKITA